MAANCNIYKTKSNINFIGIWSLDTSVLCIKELNLCFQTPASYEYKVCSFPLTSFGKQRFKMFSLNITCILIFLLECISLTHWPTTLFSRSPWSNAYDPPLDDGAMPSDRLRRLEIDANAAFDQYRELWVYIILLI